MSCSAERLPQRAAGFTLLEVLVALAVLAIALSASLRAVGMLAGQQRELHRRMLAAWSADTALSEALATGSGNGLSRACPQADVALDCTVTVSPTGIRGLRLYQVSVQAPGDPTVLARLGAASDGTELEDR